MLPAGRLGRGSGAQYRARNGAVKGAAKKQGDGSSALTQGDRLDVLYSILQQPLESVGRRELTLPH